MTEVIESEKNEDQPIPDQLERFQYFPSSIYRIMKPEFLDIVREVSEEYINVVKKDQEIDKIYPLIMSSNLFHDIRLKEFSNYVGGTAYNILDSQGHYLEGFEMYFMEMWLQEHHKTSNMEQHIHKYGSQIVGFYFTEVPENSSKVIFYDPRPGKVQTSLPEKDSNTLSEANDMINFIPTPGMLMLTNSWLPHSFTRNSSDDPVKFVHFNLSIKPKDIVASSPAEII